MSLSIRPRALREYYATLEDLRARGVGNEMGQVVRVSVETVDVIGGLPALDGEAGEEEG